MVKKNLALFFRKYHKWIALVVGLQALIWCISGLYMTSIHIDTVRGNHLVKSQPNIILPNQLADIDKTLQRLSDARFKKLSVINEQPILVIEDQSNIVKVNLSSGKEALPLNQSDIATLAKKHYAGNAKLDAVDLLASFPAEIGGRNKPVWKVTYDDILNSTLYFNVENGQLIRARSDLWRWFDFLWMLHIMDYESRENVNNNLLRIAASLGLVFTLSGFGLLFYSFGHRKQKEKSVTGVLKSLHKWLAIVIGIQLVIWILSGLVFSLLDHQKVSGRYLYTQPLATSFELNLPSLVKILNSYSELLSIEAKQVHGKDVYLVHSLTERFIVDASDLSRVSISDSLVRKIGQGSFAGKGELTGASRIDSPTVESRKFPHP